MGAHEAIPVTTQSRFPWKTTLRTAVQVGIPAFIAFAALVPEVLQVVLDQFGKVLPDEVRVVLLGIAALITGVAAVLARISAIPGVIAFTRKYLPFLAPDNGEGPAAPQIKLNLTSAQDPGEIADAVMKRMRDQNYLGG